MAHIWKAAVQPVLSYTTQSMCLRKSDFQALDQIQSRSLKAALGLSKICKNTPLLQALKIHKISDLISGYTLSLLKSHFSNNSISQKIYSFLLKKHTLGAMTGHNDLIIRCNDICQNNGISVWKFVFYDNYTNV